jgi:hypothetical protein
VQLPNKSQTGGSASMNRNSAATRKSHVMIAVMSAAVCATGVTIYGLATHSFDWRSVAVCAGAGAFMGVIYARYPLWLVLDLVVQLWR